MTTIPHDFEHLGHKRGWFGLVAARVRCRA